jgi:hypothetical protein
VPNRIAPELAHRRSILGGLARQRAAPDKIQAARAELRRASLDNHIKKLLEQTPPLTAEERLHLTRLLTEPERAA